MKIKLYNLVLCKAIGGLGFGNNRLRLKVKELGVWGSGYRDLQIFLVTSS